MKPSAIIRVNGTRARLDGRRWSSADKKLAVILNARTARLLDTRGFDYFPNLPAFIAEEIAKEVGGEIVFIEEYDLPDGERVVF